MDINAKKNNMKKESELSNQIVEVEHTQHTLEVTGCTINFMLHECGAIRFWRFAEIRFVFGLYAFGEWVRVQ